MQEEIEHKTVNLAISTTKLSARTLLRGMQFLLRQYDKHASQGKQSMKRLVRQNRGVTNVEIQETGMPSTRSGASWGIPCCSASRCSRPALSPKLCWVPIDSEVKFWQLIFPCRAISAR